MREQPGWITFSLDGKLAYPSTGEVIDTATKKIITALADETGPRRCTARRWLKFNGAAASRWQWEISLASEEW